MSRIHPFGVNDRQSVASQPCLMTWALSILKSQNQVIHSPIAFRTIYKVVSLLFALVSADSKILCLFYICFSIYYASHADRNLIAYIMIPIKKACCLNLMLQHAPTFNNKQKCREGYGRSDVDVSRKLSFNIQGLKNA